MDHKQLLKSVLNKMPFKLSKLFVAHVKAHLCVCKDSQSGPPFGARTIDGMPWVDREKRRSKQEHKQHCTAPGREDSNSREQGALILKLAWEPVQFYNLFCFPRLKYSLHCPTEFCSSFDVGGHWPFPLLRTMSSGMLCWRCKHSQIPPPMELSHGSTE